MATLTIRKFNEEDKRLLRIRAAYNEHSMEEEARRILHRGLLETEETTPQNLATAIREILDEHGLDGLDIPEVERTPAPDPISFK